MTTGGFDDVLAANVRFADAFGHGALERPPRRSLLVLTCMDARIDPITALGLEPGDAAILRNAGALVTDDVLRSLLVAERLLGVRRALVVGHTDCGLEGITREELTTRLGEAVESVDVLPFERVEDSVRAGVERIRSSELLTPGFEAAGAVYDVRSGRLRRL